MQGTKMPALQAWVCFARTHAWATCRASTGTIQQTGLMPASYSIRDAQKEHVHLGEFDGGYCGIRG